MLLRTILLLSHQVIHQYPYVPKPERKQLRAGTWGRVHADANDDRTAAAVQRISDRMSTQSSDTHRDPGKPYLRVGLGIGVAS